MWITINILQTQVWNIVLYPTATINISYGGVKWLRSWLSWNYSKLQNSGFLTRELLCQHSGSPTACCSEAAVNSSGTQWNWHWDQPYSILSTFHGFICGSYIHGYFYHLINVFYAVSTSAHTTVLQEFLMTSICWRHVCSVPQCACVGLILRAPWNWFLDCKVGQTSLALSIIILQERHIYVWNQCFYTVSYQIRHSLALDRLVFDRRMQPS